MDSPNSDFLTDVFVNYKQDQVFDKGVRLRSEEGQIRLLLNVMSQHDMVPGAPTDIKNAKQSEEFRQEANRLIYTVPRPLTEDNCIQVLKLYNRSIAYAPCESQQLALGYANRSSVLFDLKKYDLCIRDIDRACALRTCVDHVLAQLYVRKVDCLKALGNPNVEDAVKETSLKLERLDLTDALKTKFNNALDSTTPTDEEAPGPSKFRYRDPAEPKRHPRSVLKPSSQRVPKTDPKPVPKTDPKPVPKTDPKSVPKRDPKQSRARIEKRNPEAPCASDAVGIAYNEKYGRHLVATRAIAPGELLIQEKPYTMILAAEKIYSNCYNCFKVTWDGIPCNHCTSAMYCSEECKTTSWRKYHDIECSVFPNVCEIKMKSIEMYMCSLRIAIQAVREFPSIEELRAEVAKINNCKDPRTKGFSDEDVLAGDKYRNVLGLSTNADKLAREELFLLAFHSSCVLYCVATRTDLFQQRLESDPAVLANNSDVVFIGSLLLKNLLMIRINGHTIYEEYEAGNWVKSGFGVMPLSSLMNHSCRPNTMLERVRAPLTQSIRRVSKNRIRKGEQLFDCYSPCDPITSKENRQAVLLELYHFKCNCPSCR